MTAACFVDANVLVYSTDRSEPSKLEIARALLQKFWREQTGRTSMQALKRVLRRRHEKVVGRRRRRTRIKTAAARRRLPGALRSE